jgi:hypothetical protein
MSSAQNAQNELDVSKPNDRSVTICLLCCCTVILIGLGAALLAIAMSAPEYTSPGEACPVSIAPPKNYTIEVPIFQVWTDKNYINNISNSSLEISQVCPSNYEDFALWINGKMAGKTETVFWSLSRKFEIKDCHGNLQFIGKTENYTLSDALKLQTSLQIYNTKNELIAFVERDNFWNKEIKLKDEKNNLITRMHRSVLSWTWYIETSQPNHPLANPLTIAVIIQKRSQEIELDLCNNFFSEGLKFFIGMVIICLCNVCYTIVALFTKEKPESPHEQLNEEGNAH